MEEKEIYKEWKNARWEDYKNRLPEGTSEFSFLHAWLKYGIIHNFLVVELR